MKSGLSYLREKLMASLSPEERSVLEKMESYVDESLEKAYLKGVPGGIVWQKFIEEAIGKPILPKVWVALKLRLAAKGWKVVPTYSEDVGWGLKIHDPIFHSDSS